MTPNTLVLVSFIIGLVGLIDCKNLPQKTATDMRDKRGLDQSFGYGDWTAPSTSWNPSPSTWNPSSWAVPKSFPPSPNEVAHIITAAKQATADVFAAQQRVAAAKEEVIEQQRSAKEKEAQALIASQKAESLQQILRSEAQHVVFAQQKLAKAKADAAETQRLASVKESEAASAIQLSAHHAYAEIQKAEQAAKIAALKRAHHSSGISSPIPLRSAFPITPAKIVPLTFSSDPWKPIAFSPYIQKGPWY